MNKIIGLVGEDPNDTMSIKNLLLQRYNTGYSYVELVKRKRGSQLDNKSTRESLQIECETKRPDIVIFIRDADGVATEATKIEKCKSWYQTMTKSLSCKKALLINIYELEALLFADIDAFNRLYNVSIKGDRDVTFIAKPKEELIRKTEKLRKRYSESDCPEIFKSLNIDVVSRNCTYFKTFLDEFDGQLALRN